MKLGELGLSCRGIALGGLRDSPPPALSGQAQPPTVEKGLFPRAEPQHADAEKQMSLSTSTSVTATRTAGDLSSATTCCPSSSKGQEQGCGLGDPGWGDSHGHSPSWSCCFYLCSTFAYLTSKTHAPSAMRVQHTTEEPNRQLFAFEHQLCPARVTCQGEAAALAVPQRDVPGTNPALL